MTHTETYDPMIYDVMRESANRLIGEYMYLAHRTKDAVMRNALLDAINGVRKETSMVNADSREAVEEKTAEFSQRASNMRRFRLNGPQMGRDHMVSNSVTSNRPHRKRIA
ncbi:hypothetical protein [Bifidobacterium tissieri]|uniref:Uncharacterized protein n=1 Tax=Bifidobacterium tissieri TaxID=1630162 RepID=A0A5M9ZTI9_9BIFI|nr:hypothetical protein [Bifidobacterium tissieri]KAA8830100.1 hypothetical protein EMO89_06850 [Bifidobacterium tissieri]KAA8830956.1 hypothetical protein EM849_08825 [Bifidobacterium tissieri]